MSSGVAVLDSDGTIVAVNAAWRAFADENGGRDSDHFLGWDYPSACDGADAPAARGLRAVLSGESAGFEHEYPCHAPHRERWMRMRARGFEDGGRRFVAVVHEDISARVGAERARDRQLALLRAVFDSALDAIVTIDERGRIEAVNPAVGRMFGYAEAALLGRNVSVLMPQPDRGRHDGYIADYLRTGRAKVIGIGREVTGQRADGTRFPLLLQVSETLVGGRRVFTGVLHDLSERKAAEAERLERERRELVVRELGHRIKNVFATVASVSHMLSRTAGGVAEYRDALGDRLRSLAATQALLTDGARQGVMLDELLAFELAAYSADGRGIDVAGEGVRLSAQAGQLLGMAIHELATNSAKYGALSAPRGRLTVRWHRAGRGTARRLEFVWTERGGPPVAPPQRRGFGTTLIERSLRAGLGADVTLDFAPEGLVCRICLPLDKLEGRARRDDENQR